jgi:hypothetical protein
VQKQSMKLSPQHALLGRRSKRGSIDPRATFNTAIAMINELPERIPIAADNLKTLKPHFVDECRLYYTLAAVSRRQQLDASLRSNILTKLYPLRSAIERAILACLPLLHDQKSLWRDASSKSFFGVSAKQGVSVRFGLSSCVPTKKCGGRCYAHDGRDRELHLIFRAVLNQFVGESFESGTSEEQQNIMRRLSKAIEYGIKSARLEAQQASTMHGYSREPRIRFSHIGEMVHTPVFTNTLAREIILRAPDVKCVTYTRHPNARALDLDLMVVNFTVEGDVDPRRKLAPSGSRIVNSSWDGNIVSDVSVNFLEHHVEKTNAPKGTGHICPVTVDHLVTPSCDSARCDLCFRKPSPAIRSREMTDE